MKNSVWIAVSVTLLTTLIHADTAGKSTSVANETRTSVPQFVKSQAQLLKPTHMPHFEQASNCAITK